jgi:nucleotide-binding universal stress UspA family protein
MGAPLRASDKDLSLPGRSHRDDPEWKGSGGGTANVGLMTQVVVPVRYPLSKHSRETLAEAIRIAEQEGATLTVLHVDLYQNGKRVTRSELKRAVEEEFGPVPAARYAVRQGLLVEEAILEEAAAEGADVVVIGKKQASRWRAMVRRLVDDPDIEAFLREELDCDVVTVPAT